MKLKMKNLSRAFILLISFANAVVGSRAFGETAIRTVYPTKDWVVSDFIVTDPEFGAKAEPGFDNREAFQKAIDAAYHDGGGVVYVPAGRYEFRSVQIGKRITRGRRGGAGTSTDYEYTLQLRPGVQLRGDWANPDLNDGKVLGTILEVRTGKDTQNNLDRFIEMPSSTGVTNLSIWHPEQDVNDVKPYPWALYQTSGDSATMENVTLVNAYNGFYSAPSELHYVVNSYMTVLKTGVEVHVCTDIGRIENVHINPKYWVNSGLPGSPSLAEATAYTRANGTGYRMHRSDWEYVSYLNVSGYKTGMWVGREPGSRAAPNAQFFGLRIDDCGTGLHVEEVNPYGLLFSNSAFGADADGVAAYFSGDFNTSTQFNGVDFTGPVVTDGREGGVISFENCTFDKYGEYALKINNGNVLLTQCEFRPPAGHVYLGADAKRLKSLNSGLQRKLDVVNESAAAEVEMTTGDEYVFEPIPKNLKTDIAVHPKPKSNTVLKVDLPRAAGLNDDAPTEDVADELQAALDAVKAGGGGTVYLPAGRYLVESPVTIPSGVELRGNWDVQHHTRGGGTALFTNYAGGEAGEKGESLVKIEADAGIRGLNIVQNNLVTGEFDANNPRPTPFLIQGRGPDVYVINVTIVLGDKGIDLASFNTSGHYVDYFAGVVTRAGIWVGGGAEGGFIRNMQFNPHYGSRPPLARQGYPVVNMMRYVQANCSQLKFADVKNQTIFNNFVYGSVYGIHFLKDAVTGNYPGEMIVIGHGSDGCTFSLFVEDADKDTKIIGINSELVNTQIPGQAVRSYVRMGDEANTAKVHPDARLILYNTAFWGSPTVGGIINNGVVRYQQANFQSPGEPAIDVRGGKAHVYSSYFQGIRRGDAYSSGRVAVSLETTGISAELTNNHFPGFEIKSEKPEGTGIYGSDVR
ncbi:MAG TPA: poly(beta-D-mannuronate) C5 epimerase [Planctomycetaceae bacterium]|nr:poly(beta-D-mannuronate) C5 epimerase [Planctomycetaceae bacterium]